MHPDAKAQLRYGTYTTGGPYIGAYMRGEVNATGNTVFSPPSSSTSSAYPSSSAAYSGFPSSAHPFFHSAAAVAAVAAAAAGYSQQLSTSTLPLNLSNLNASSREAYSAQFYGSHQGVSAYDYYNYYQQYSGRYASAFQPTGSNHQNLGSQESAVKSQMSYASPSLSTPLTVAAGSNYLSVASEASTINSYAKDRTAEQFSTANSAASKMPSSGRKTKKNRISGSGGEDLAEEKRKEFEKLVKARTDKLLYDGPIYTSTANGPAELASSGGSNCSAGGPEGTDSMAVTNAKLIKGVLDAKICLLLNSPHVMTFLQSRQRLLEEYKRATDLFSVADTATSSNPLCASDLTLAAKIP
uniref:Regulatory factor X-associated C-terminal binding domain n=1 Tax=Schistocephalus solidus TaxID=70667 RepID=A0A0X3NXQ2_SCHSO